MSRRRQALRALLVAGSITLVAVLSGPGAAASTSPSGETKLGQSLIEPAYDSTTGETDYVLTPTNPNTTQVHSNPASWAPFWVIMYPAGWGVTVQCAHLPKDNCPDHGFAVAGAAAAIEPAVYGSGVLGHDHMMAPPASGGDFNIAWHVFLALLTPAAPAGLHITTLAGLRTAEANGWAFDVPTPIVFHCSVVPGVTYSRGTPVQPV